MIKESKKSKRVSQKFKGLLRRNNFNVRRTGRYIFYNLNYKIFFMIMGKQFMEKNAKAIEEVCNNRGYKFLAITFRDLKNNQDKIINNINLLKNISEPSSNLIKL